MKLPFLQSLKARYATIGTLTIGAFVWLLLATAVAGGDLYSPCSDIPATTMCRPTVCCDNYCSKPRPCIACPSFRWCCDDYCAKPWALLRCPDWRTTCDDYCRKPLPRLCWPENPAPYVCDREEAVAEGSADPCVRGSLPVKR